MTTNFNRRRFVGGVAWLPQMISVCPRRTVGIAHEAYVTLVFTQKPSFDRSAIPLGSVADRQHSAAARHDKAAAAV
jgi:hypothetical protein